jgi:dTDP-4-amino-4,6-dideoxygalactose transaminase
MYVPTFQGLTPTDFVRAADCGRSRFPFDVPHLSFYRARNAIYYLFRSLKSTNAKLSVLVPDYNSGNEVLALEAARATVHYYPVGRDGQADPAQVERLCAVHHPDVLYVIHYLGWPQPVRQLAALCRARGMWMVEDCALALLSDAGTEPLGTFGHWSIFCLYKTLPLPNGACLVQNNERLEPLERISLRRAGLPSVLGQTAELMVRGIRSRSDGLGAAMQSMKRAAGRAAGAMDVARASVGDIGFNLDEVDLAMSELSMRLLKRLDFERIRRQRIANYRRLAAELEGSVNAWHAELPDGVCPLFFPILVDDKPGVAELLKGRGVDALQFWNHGAPLNHGADPNRVASSPNTGFLREHVLGLPIHQDLTSRHIDYVAQHVRGLNLRMS